MSFNFSCFPRHRSRVLTDYFNIYEDMNVIQGVLESWLDDQRRARRQQRSRDRLACELEELRNKVEESLHVRENERYFHNPEKMPLEEKLLYFLDWRSQLQILHSSISSLLVIARRLRKVYSKAEIRSLQEIQDDLANYLYETDYFHQRAREKLEELRNCPQKRRSGQDDGYQSPLMENSLGNHSNKYLMDIVKDAEKIKTESIEASLRLENEIEMLKAKCTDMTKDVVALSKVIEYQKKELVDLTRMKRNNELAEKELKELE